jgi:hypothetical protein
VILWLKTGFKYISKISGQQKYLFQKRNNSQDSGVLLSPSPQAERRRTLSTNTEGGRSKANSPTPREERGHTASPSLDRLVHGGGGGGVGGRFHQSEDNSSLASLSLR